jgi:hypothetical protein
MPDIDFAMSYPCYFLERDDGGLEDVLIDGKHCLCLFTDDDILKSFYKAKHGVSPLDRTITTIECQDYDQLMACLDGFEEDFAKPNCNFLAIDPTAGKMAGYVEIGEFKRELKPK